MNEWRRDRLWCGWPTWPGNKTRERKVLLSVGWKNFLYVSQLRFFFLSSSSVIKRRQRKKKKKHNLVYYRVQTHANHGLPASQYALSVAGRVICRAIIIINCELVLPTAEPSPFGHSAVVLIAGLEDDCVNLSSTGRFKNRLLVEWEEKLK